MVWSLKKSGKCWSLLSALSDTSILMRHSHADQRISLSHWEVHFGSHASGRGGRKSHAISNRIEMNFPKVVELHNKSHSTRQWLTYRKQERRWQLHVASDHCTRTSCLMGRLKSCLSQWHISPEVTWALADFTESKKRALKWCGDAFLVRMRSTAQDELVEEKHLIRNFFTQKLFTSKNTQKVPALIATEEWVHWKVKRRKTFEFSESRASLATDKLLFY